MLIGYARVSTHEQTLDLQKDALHKAGCEKIFTDKTSGAKFERMGLEDVLKFVRPSDTLVVWKLDRLGRSLKHLVETVTGLHERAIGFKSLTEQIDTTTPSGKLIFHVFAALAEFERDLIRERTLAGMEAARSRGHVGGRPLTLTPDQVTMLKQMYYEKNYEVNNLLRLFKITRSSFYRYINPDKYRLKKKHVLPSPSIGKKELPSKIK
jgi:DNA invertase Pin-like site-specific DNA recombinase